MTLIEILGPIVQFITTIIFDLGYIGIFLLMVLESALIPIPSEIIMPFSGFVVTTGKLGFVGVVLAGSFGNLVGSIATYYLGLKVGRTFLTRYGKYILFKQQHLASTERLFKQYGDKLTFIGRLLPVVRTYISLPAGIGKTGFLKFVAYTLAGSLLWNLALTIAGMQLGYNWKQIEKYSSSLDIVAIIVIAVIILWLFKSRRKHK
jgi:membrane protein DedA with SNARE-associated domain